MINQKRALLVVELDNRQNAGVQYMAMPYLKYAKIVRGQKWVEDLRNLSVTIM